MRQVIFRSGRRLLAGLLPLLLGLDAQAASYQPPHPALSLLPWDGQQAELQHARDAIAQAVLPPQETAVPAGRAHASLETMFSSQQGSWYFEPFARNGLFRAIAGYQAHHPQAVVISGGSLTLEQLSTALNDPRVLKRHKDGYLLSYPLVIAPGAALRVEGSTLYLYTPSGTALINRGLLQLKGATLSSWKGESPGDTQDPYRPFVMAWAGSTLHIEDSHLERLGYNANFTRGITTALSPQQPASTAPARVLVRNSTFNDLSTALELQHARARVQGSRFSDQQQYAVDLKDSQVEVLGNRIDGVQNNSGLRARGQVSGLIADNSVLNTAKAGIEVVEQQGALGIRRNLLGASRGTGILLNQLAPSELRPLLLEGNLIGNTQGSGIDANNVGGALFLVGNQIGNSPEYAISLRNPQRLPGRLVLTGNTLGGIGKAMVRVEGLEQIVLGGNRFQGNPVLQSAFIGDLLPVQSQVLESTVRHPCLLRVDTGAGAPTAELLLNEGCKG
ncbi:right-handed parallel beta-helix repeat-containing protein [Metapseudomonas otitidis]|uniref:right-handed parallel beta-helix repeat-containing protein n=1 Tax=Metapseudomonas otitidis TaxID=319939 RepID=UPI0039FC3D24